MSGSPFGIGEFLASKKASDVQAEAASTATNLQKYMFDKASEQTAPWRKAGETALAKLIGKPIYETERKITGYEPVYTPSRTIAPGALPYAGTGAEGGVIPGMQDFGHNYLVPRQEIGKKPIYGDVKTAIGYEGGLLEGPGEFIPEEQPGYKFGYEEFIEKPTLRLAAARGNLRSGATEKALTRYAQDYASTQYDNFLNRWYKSLDPYFSLAGMGQTTAGQLGSQAIQTGANMANTTLAGGEAQAAGYLGMGNILSRQFGGIGQGVMNWQQMNQMRNILNQNQQPNNLWSGGYYNSPTYGNMTAGEMNSMIWL